MKNYLTKAEEQKWYKVLNEMFTETKNTLFNVGYKEVYDNKYNIQIKVIGSGKLAICQFCGRDFYNNSKLFNIIFNSNYLAFSTTDKIKNTMMHEMIHSLDGCMSHTGRWKEIATRISYLMPQYQITRSSDHGNEYYKNVIEKQYKYEIECKKCHSKWKYQRMTKTIQACSKGNATCSCGSKDFKVITLR